MHKKPPHTNNMHKKPPHTNNLYEKTIVQTNNFMIFFVVINQINKRKAKI